MDQLFKVQVKPFLTLIFVEFIHFVNMNRNWQLERLNIKFNISFFRPFSFLLCIINRHEVVVYLNVVSAFSFTLNEFEEQEVLNFLLLQHLLRYRVLIANNRRSVTNAQVSQKLKEPSISLPAQTQVDQVLDYSVINLGFQHFRVVFEQFSNRLTSSKVIVISSQHVLPEEKVDLLAHISLVHWTFNHTVFKQPVNQSADSRNR